jgi:hypothetical protein
VATLLEEAVSAGELRKEVQPESMAYNIFCAVEGAIMISRVQGDIRPMQEVITYWRNQIKQLAHS